MKNINQLRRTIEKTKEKLIEKAKTEGLYENFGQEEVRDIEDEFDYIDLAYGTEKERRMADMIHQFDEWCMTFTI